MTFETVTVQQLDCDLLLGKYDILATLSRLDEEQLSFSDTATDAVTDLINVERQGTIGLLQDATLLSRSCLVHTVDHFDSEGLVVTW